MEPDDGYNEEDGREARSDIDREEASRAEVTRAWSDFVERGVDPHDSSAVRPEIADSWVRSRTLGIDPYATSLSKPLPEDEYERIVRVYKPLIDIVRPRIDIIKKLAIANDYLFELVARNGVTLLRDGNLSLHNFVAPRSIFSEETMGTNAHSLCMRLKRPCQVLGSEHYAAALHGLVGEAAPILNGNADVMGALLLTQPLPEGEIPETYRKLLSHALGLIASTASAIEYSIRLLNVSVDLERKSSESARMAEELNRMQVVLDRTIAASSDPFLIVSLDGDILKASPETAHILGCSPLDLVDSKMERAFDVSWDEDFGKALATRRSARQDDHPRQALRAQRQRRARR